MSIDKKQYLLFVLPFLFSFGKIVAGSWLALISSFLWICMVFSYSNSYPQQNKQRPLAFAMITCVVISFLITARFRDYVEVFVDQNYLLPYFAILIGYCHFSFRSINRINHIIFVSAICFLVFFYFNMRSIFEMDGVAARLLLREDNMPFDNVTKRFCIGAGFLLLLGPYLKKWMFWVALLAMSVNIAAALYMGRRNVIVTSLLFFLIAGYRFFIYEQLKRPVKYLLVLFMVIGVSFIMADIISFFQDNPFFDVLNSRFDRDTRSNVTNYFYLDMNNNPIQWLIGKGITSTYYCPDVMEDIIYRKTVETGWQHIILKMGTPFLLLYLGIQIKSIYRCKKNFLTTACSFYILIMIIELLYAGVPTLDLRYVLIWICVSFCNNREIQSLKNSEIKKLLKD